MGIWLGALPGFRTVGRAEPPHPIQAPFAMRNPLQIAHNLP